MRLTYVSLIISSNLQLILVFIPLLGDEPVAAVYVTENLHASFELFQVWSGEDLKPLHRNGLTPAGLLEAVGIEVQQIIDLCQSKKGQETRSNSEKLKVEFANAWEDGTARQEIHMSKLGMLEL